jgi:hypothetical protein
MRVGALVLINVNFLTLASCLKEGLAKIEEVSSKTTKRQFFKKHKQGLMWPCFFFDAPTRQHHLPNQQRCDIDDIGRRQQLVMSTCLYWQPVNNDLKKKKSV